MLDVQNGEICQVHWNGSSQLTPMGESSLAHVLRLIETDPDLPEFQRIRWRSCLTRVARHLGRELDALPAHMTGLRYGVSRLHHAQLGISAKNLQNLKSDLKAILQHVGALGTPFCCQSPC